MHAPGATDFYVEVEPIGTFTFAKRTMRDELRILAEVSRLTEGVESPTAQLSVLAGWLAPLKVLTVRAPEGWDLETLDPLDPESYQKLIKVYGALRDKEGSFRRGTSGDGEGGGAKDGEKPGVLVPAKTQPGAD